MFDGRFRTGVDRAVKPIGRMLTRTGLSPDHLTALGLLLAVPTAVAIAAGHLLIGLVLLVAAAVPDLLDGALAKALNRTSVRGAFFDSVADRVTDTFILAGVAWYLQSRHHGHAFLLPVAVLGASLLISYLRAKAESLGFDAKGGIMERAERVIVLCLGLLVSVLLVPVLWVMLVLTLVTAGQRFAKVWRQATVADAARRSAPSPSPSLAPDPAPVTAADPARPVPAPPGDRWRAWREAGGWSARPSRFAQGSRRSGSTWHDRRLARLERRRSSPMSPTGRRGGTRRP